MKSLLKITLALGVVATGNGQVPRQLFVRLYNLSGVPSSTLDHATIEARRIFANVDVDIIWELGLPGAEEAHTTDQRSPASVRGNKMLHQEVRSCLVVRIGRGMSGHTPVSALGFSLPDSQYGVSATIFQDRIESVSESAGLDLSMVMGHVIAHELGHVLLGSSEHTPSGIMKARWSKADFDSAATGILGFTAVQGGAMRDSRSLSRLTRIGGLPTDRPSQRDE
jgi:hypothetical protein